MNIRLFVLCAITMCALYVNAGVEKKEQKKIPEATATKIVTDYANAWIAGDIKKMYACYQPGVASFADFQKSHSSLISDKNRPKQIISIGKPYYLNEISMWAVNYTLKFDINETPIDKYYRAVFAEVNGNYSLCANVPCFSETETESIKAVVERVLTGWEKGDIDSLVQMFYSDDPMYVKNVFLSLCKSIANTDSIIPITHYQFNEPTAWSIGDITAYPEVTISYAGHESKATLKFTLFRREGTTNDWIIDSILLSAPVQTRRVIIGTVGAYLHAWMKSDVQKMYEKFYGIKGKAQDVFGPLIQTSEIPLEIKSVEEPRFPALDTAVVNYSCMFKDKNRENGRVFKSRQVRLKDIDGKWLIVADGVLPPDDNRSVESQVQAYVSNWIAKNPEGISKCFKENAITLSELEHKVKDDEEKNLIPQKFIEFLNLWSDNQDTVNIGFKVANKSGATTDYQAKLSRASGSDWFILSVTDYPDSQTTELLKEKTTAYINAWIRGDSSAVLKFFEDIENGGRGAISFIKSIKAQLKEEAKPDNLISIGKPSYRADSDCIEIPYVVGFKNGQEVEGSSGFKFNEKTHTWQLTLRCRY